MALADDPQAFIHRMFSMEAHEGRGEYCQQFPDGTRPSGVPLDNDEVVYGMYKAKYFYSPKSLTIRESDGHTKIRWADVAQCSSRHGDGSKVSVLTLVDGRQVTVRLTDFVKGWSGRTSQLYHGMIERWGCKASFGPPPLTVEEFFVRASDEYSFAPNIEPHPSLESLRLAFKLLGEQPDVRRVMLLPSNGPDEELAVTRVIVVTSGPCEAVLRFAQSLGATSVGELDAGLMRNLGFVEPNFLAQELAWS